MGLPFSAGYISVAFIAARLAAPALGVTNGTASLNGFATLTAQPTFFQSANINGIANVTAGIS